MAATTSAASTIPWYRTVTREQWRVLLAAKFGWMLDAMDFMLYTMAVGPAPRLLRLRRRHCGHARDGHAGDVGCRRRNLRLRRGPLRPYAGADGHDPDLLVRLARRGDVANGDAAALLARAPRHRDGRRMGVGRGAGQRDLAGPPSQQGDQHHAVGMGARLHDGVDFGRDHPRRPVARRRRLALAVRRRRRAGLLHLVDSPLRSRA